MSGLMFVCPVVQLYSLHTMNVTDPAQGKTKAQDRRLTWRAMLERHTGPHEPPLHPCCTPSQLFMPSILA